MRDGLLFTLEKVDEATHTVWGVATAEKPDLENDICDYPSAKVAYQKWSGDALAKTTAAGQEPSLGNVRIMHTHQLGGKVIDIQYDDANKKIRVASTPVNDEVWKLLKGGFLTGYSHGGTMKVLGKEGMYRRYAPNLAELSYVDKGCVDEGFEFVKADGSVEMRKFSTAPRKTVTREALKKSLNYEPPPEAIGVSINGELFDLVLEKREFSDEERKKLAGEGKALPDGSFPIESVEDLHNAIQAVGRASDPARAKAHIRARAKALGQTALLPDSWDEGSEKFVSPGDKPMDAKEKQEFEDLKKSVGELKKMTEAQGAHLQAIKTHHDGMGEHLASMVGEAGAKSAKAEDLKKADFVSVGKDKDGVEIFKKADGPAPTAEVTELKAKVDSFEKVLTDLNEGIQKLFGKKDETVHIPGLAKAVADVTVISKGADGADPTKKEEGTKVFTSAADAAKDPEFIKSTLGKPFGNEMELAAASMRKSAAA